MHYEISRGFHPGRPLTTAQRTSGTFAEEPVVLGKVLRRGTRPMLLTEKQFEQSKASLLRLLLSGSIEIHVIDQEREPARIRYQDFVAAARAEPPAPVSDPPPPPPPAGEKKAATGTDGNPSTTGDGQNAGGPATPGEDEEQEANEPPSSETTEEES